MSELSTRDKILGEAERQFVKQGIEATQMKDIAEAVGINRRTLYRYFPTKDVLAFAVEMIVMKQIGDYLAPVSDHMEGLTGLEKIRNYIDRVDIGEIREQMKFTAEFDRYFQDDYPSPGLEEAFVQSLDPEKDILHIYIREGIADGSIRSDLTAEEIYHFLSQNFFAFFQRLILREKHLKREYCGEMDFRKIFKAVMLSGISRENQSI